MAKGRRAADRRREREQDGRFNEASDTRQGDSREGDDVDPEAATAAFNPQRHREVSKERGNDGSLSRSVPREGPDEVTQPGTRAPRPPTGGRIVVTAGPDAGGEVPLDVSPTVVGRGPNASIALEDDKASRAHFELRFRPKPGAWTIADLGSTSGTLKNGELIDLNPVEIRHGDEICAGETRFRFLSYDIAPGRASPRHSGRGVFQKEPREPRDHRKLLLVVGVLVSVLLVAAAFAGVFVWRTQTEQRQQAELAASALLEEAKILLEKKEPISALTRIDAALELVDELDGARALKRQTRTEADAQEALQRAQKLLEAGKLEETRAALRQIPDSSRFAPEREALRKTASKAGKKRSLRDIKASIAGGDMDLAADLIEVHLTRWPGDDDALDLKLRLLEQQNRPPPKNPNLRRARAAFARANFKGARAAVEDAAKRGRRLEEMYLADLDTYESAIEAGRGRLKLKDGPSAKKSLNRAYELASRLGGGRGKSRINAELADALYLAGIALKQSGKDCAWARDVLRAYQLDARDKKVKVQKRLVDQRADAGLLRARATSSASERKQLADDALCFAQPRSKTYKSLMELARQ